MSLDGKVVVVAGATGALGRAVCRACLEAGARVAAAARKEEDLQRLADALGAGPERLHCSAVDAADAGGAEQLLADADRAHGRADALVNAAGAWEGGHPTWETDPAVYQRMLSTNLGTMFHLARAALPRMLRQGSGAVVGVASAAAHGGQAGSAAYAASKAGLLALLGSLAQEVRGRGVRVNAIVPDIIDTEANRRAMPGADFSRWVKPDDVARLVVFLCSDSAQAVHGAQIPVTAG